MPKIITDEILEVAAAAYEATATDVYLSRPALLSALEAALPMVGEAIVKKIDKIEFAVDGDGEASKETFGTLLETRRIVRALTAPEKIT